MIDVASELGQNTYILNLFLKVIIKQLMFEKKLKSLHLIAALQGYEIMASQLHTDFWPNVTGKNDS